MYYLIRSFVTLSWICRTIVLFILVLLVFGIFSQHLESSSRSVVLDSVNAMENKFLAITRDYLPTRYKKQDISRYVAPAAALILYWLINSVYSELLYRSAYFRAKKEADQLHKIAKQSSQSPETGNKRVQELHNKLEEIESAPRQDRKKLLKDFVALKQQLESMGRDLAFLSIDVVDSTGMKLNEDTYVISNDFIEYRQFVESRINTNGCIKSTWTPDGLMACFGRLDDAIKSAQSILKGLADFNKNVKTMKRDFAVRCGVNAGHIFFDDSLPLEQISDRVIDIAGHMQKHAQPNTIYIAKQIIKPPDSMKGFNEANADVDGFDAYKWDEKSAS